MLTTSPRQPHDLHDSDPRRPSSIRRGWVMRCAYHCCHTATQSACSTADCHVRLELCRIVRWQCVTCADPVVASPSSAAHLRCWVGPGRPLKLLASGKSQRRQYHASTAVSTSRPARVFGQHLMYIASQIGHLKGVHNNQPGNVLLSKSHRISR